MDEENREFHDDELPMCQDCEHESCSGKWCVRVTSLIRVQELRNRSAEREKNAPKKPEPEPEPEPVPEGHCPQCRRKLLPTMASPSVSVMWCEECDQHFEDGQPVNPYEEELDEPCEDDDEELDEEEEEYEDDELEEDHDAEAEEWGDKEEKD